jgi:hypothetical protein
MTVYQDDQCVARLEEEHWKKVFSFTIKSLKKTVIIALRIFLHFSNLCIFSFDVHLS